MKIEVTSVLCPLLFSNSQKDLLRKPPSTLNHNFLYRYRLEKRRESNDPYVSRRRIIFLLMTFWNGYRCLITRGINWIGYLLVYSRQTTTLTPPADCVFQIDNEMLQFGRMTGCVYFCQTATHTTRRLCFPNQYGNVTFWEDDRLCLLPSNRDSDTTSRLCFPNRYGNFTFWADDRLCLPNWFVAIVTYALQSLARR